MCEDIVDIVCVDIVYVPGDLLGELAGVGRVELDPEVEGDGGDGLDLLRHALPGLQPVLKTKIFVDRQEIIIRNMHKSYSLDKPEEEEINRSIVKNKYLKDHILYEFVDFFSTLVIVMIFHLRPKAKYPLKTTHNFLGIFEQLHFS